MPRRSRPARRRTLVVAAALLVSSFAGLSPANAAPSPDLPDPILPTQAAVEARGQGYTAPPGLGGGDATIQHWSWR